MNLVIPTIFTAVNKFSQPVGGMANDASQAANKIAASFNKVDASINKTFSVFSSAQKELLQTVGAVAIGNKIADLVSSSADAIVEYESSIAQFRTIVSELNDADFAPFKAEIDAVAKDTKRSSIAVAQSFEMIAGLNADFAKTADGLGQVSTASIVLSKASKAELAVSANNLVGIMNQFDLAAKDADRAINVLAAGQAVGAANITQTAEAFVNFGSTAKGANITLEQSVGLIQTLGAHSLYSEQAGTKLRGSILKLQAAGVGYKSGLFNINDALTETKAKYDKLATAKQKDAYLDKVFGAENISTGRILLADIEKFKQFSLAVTGTSEAQKAAAINSDTFKNSVTELKAAWVNMITSSSSASAGLMAVDVLIKFITEHISGITTVLSLLIAAFIAWKAILIATSAYLFIQNIAIGINSALMGESAFATWGNTVAYNAFRATVIATTAATWLMNAALSASVALGLPLWATWILIGVAVAFIISLFASFYRNWEMIKKAFTDGGILSGIKAIGVAILDSVLAPLQYVLSLIAKITGADWAKSAASGIEKFRTDLGVDVNGSAAVTPAVNPKKVEQDAMISRSESTQKQNVTIDINDSSGRANVTSSNDMVPITTTRTLGGGLSNKLY